nr:aldehyde dehydrogenase [Flexibacter flexilis]
MKPMTPENIVNIIAAQRHFFASHQTKSTDFRIKNLQKLKAAVLRNEAKIAAALWQDLHKSAEEAYLTETSIVLQEIDNHIKNLKKWTKPKRVPTPLHVLPSRSYLYAEPLGVALIIAPWNYPFQLLINPLIGAISAGCCVILKPSPFAPHIAEVMEQIIHEIFSAEYVEILLGGKEINDILLQNKFDIIFFTGSPTTGKIIAKAAAEFMTPVVLELGGKSPCIVAEDANLDVAAKRIAWGKIINAGQTCIAPDYLFVHHTVKEKLLQKIVDNFKEMLGENIKQSQYFGRIIHATAFERLNKYLQGQNIVFGGETDAQERYISPTLLDNILPENPIMQEEIFGPILPIMTYTQLSEVIDFVNKNEKPLALYFFSEDDAKINEILTKTSSGGACVNDTLMHIANHHLPFGGVGNSGMGAYHGHFSFEIFSHKKAVVRTPTWVDLPLKYTPFKYFDWIKKIL